VAEEIFLARSLDAHSRQLLPQFFQASFADESDRSLRQSEIAGHFLVWPRRAFEEQQLYELPAPRRERGQGLAHSLFLLQLSNQGAGFIGRFRQFIAFYFLLLLAPLFLLAPKTFVAGDLNQPGGQRLRLPQTGHFRQQFHTDRLKDVRGILLRKAIPNGNGKNQVLILLN